MFHSITEVDKQEWDCLAEDHILMCHGWLKTIEETYSANLSPRYLIFYELDRPVIALAYRQVTTKWESGNIDHFLFGRIKPFFAFLGISRMPAIASMPLKGYANVFLVDSRIERSEIQDKLQLLLDHIHDHSLRERIPIVFTRVNADDRQAAHLLKENGYARILAAPLAYIDIVWQNFSDYKNDASRIPRNTRRKINWEINRNQKEGIEIVVLESLQGYEDRLYEMVTLNAVKHHQKAFPYGKNFFSVLAENIPNQFRVYAAFKKKRLIGMSLFLTKGKIWHALMVGIDHHQVGNDLTYFNISFYRPIRDAIDTRCSRIYYGNSNYELKLRRGCQIQSVDAYYKPCGVFRRAVLYPFFFVHRACNWRKLLPMVRRRLMPAGTGS